MIAGFRGCALGRCLVAALLGLVLQGCATVTQPDPRDPLQSFNRSVFTFNDALDRDVLQPVASTYRDITPSWLRKGVSNFFNNLEDLWSAFNNVLQLRGGNALDNLARVAVNSTVGVLGVVDVATPLEIERHKSDFGLTLGRWGVPAGPFLVLPLLGPSTLRDTAALPVDRAGDVLQTVDDEPTRSGATVIKLVNWRASLLGAGAVVDGAALDKYSFMRDAYLQRRRNQVYDGNPPDEEEFEPEPEAAPDAPVAPAPQGDAAVAQ